MTDKQLNLPIPSYIFDDAELVSLMWQLRPFAIGDQECGTPGVPCPRAVTAMKAIAEELRWRGGTVEMNTDGTWTVTPAQRTVEIVPTVEVTEADRTIWTGKGDCPDCGASFGDLHDEQCSNPA